MSKWKKFFKGLGVISVPALCVYAIAGAVVVPLLIFETGASKEYNATAKTRTENHWLDDFADPRIVDTNNKVTDTLEKHFTWNEIEGTGFTVDGRDSKIYELTGPDANATSDKLMIFSHGLNSTHWNAMESAFYWSKMGYRVIAWDQRGGGDNRDSHITFGYSEADDLSNLYDVVVNNTPDASKNTYFDNVKNIVMYGQSNGAATTIAFADRFQKEIKDAKKDKNIETKFIEESGYTSPKRQFQTALNLHGILPAAVVPLTIPMYELYAERNLADKDTDYLANSKNIGQPLFIAHGDADPIVDFQMGVDLYKMMKNNSQDPSIYIGKGLKHIGVSRASDINKDGATLDAISKVFDDLVKTPSSLSPADAKKQMDNFDNNIAAGYPDAVRFFYHVYMWDNFGITTEEVGGHVK